MQEAAYDYIVPLTIRLALFKMSRADAENQATKCNHQHSRVLPNTPWFVFLFEFLKCSRLRSVCDQI